MIQKINSIGDIVSRYKLFLIDQWGVLHNGRDILGYAQKALNIIKAEHESKHITILSNSGKRADHSRALLEQIGFDIANIDDVVTSGEAAFQWMLRERDVSLKNIRNIMFYAWDNNRDILKGLHFNEVHTIERAELIIMAGMDRGTTESYYNDLHIAKERNISLICTNPDLYAQTPNGGLKECPGKVAQYYENLGGNVYWFGKPKQQIYDMALYLYKNGDNISISPKDILCIGDSLHHDIQGGINNGFDTLFIESGIHYADIQEIGRNAVFNNHNITPTYSIGFFE